MNTKLTYRNDEIERLFRAGVPMTTLASRFNISRQRIQQILKSGGLSRHDGGHLVRSEVRRERREIERDELAMNRKGCDYRTYRELISTGVTKAFREKRRTSRYQYPDVEWRLSLWDFWSVWRDSGLWDSKGTGRGAYGMTRIHPSSHWEIGNVKIESISHISRQMLERRRAKEQ